MPNFLCYQPNQKNWKLNLDNLKIGKYFSSYEIGEKEKVSDVIETLLLDIKEEEFGEGKYEITAYEKKLLFAGMLLEKTLSSLVNKSKGMDSLLEMLKMLGEDGPDDGSEDIQ